LSAGHAANVLERAATSTRADGSRFCSGRPAACRGSPSADRNPQHEHFQVLLPYGILRAGIEASGAAAPGPMGFSLESRNKSGIPE
ncbi:MAG: hypothetical protein ACREA4_07835, partial [Nitrososphaera sp.]